MDTNTRNRQQSQPPGSEGFDFEQWASEVKELMLTSLQRNKENIRPLEESIDDLEEEE